MAASDEYRRRSLLALALAIALAAAAPTAAPAATAEVSTYFGRGFINYKAAPGEHNDVTVTRSGSSIIIKDPGATILSATCSLGVSARRATCTIPAGNAFAATNFALGNQADKLRIDFVGGGHRKPVQNGLQGDAGNDTITGSNGRSDFDYLLGGAGNDKLSGRGGDDIITDYDFDGGPPYEGGSNRLFGGNGDDFIEGGPRFDRIKGGNGDDDIDGGLGHDILSGGPGFDAAEFRALESTPQGNPTHFAVVVNLRRGKARIRGHKQTDRLLSFEDAYGTDRGDMLIGNGRINLLSGRAGNDTIIGGGAPDQLYGGSDRDLIKAKDGAADRVACGGNAGDRAKHDRFDKVSGC